MCYHIPMKGEHVIKILTLSGSSGSGKTSIVQEILKRRDHTCMLSSITTRIPRVSDVPGEYIHVGKEEFDARKSRGEFLEYDEPHGDCYGTLRSSFHKALQGDGLRVKAISLKGAEALYGAAPDAVVPFYIIPPPEATLRDRLRRRGDNEDLLEKRIADCISWYEKARHSSIPFVMITNDGALSEVLDQITQHLRYRSQHLEIDHVL